MLVQDQQVRARPMFELLGKANKEIRGSPTETIESA